MSANSVMIDGVEYVRRMPEGDIKIVIVDRGFVYIGNVEDNASFLTLRNAQNIRVWGTSKGLGELVGGPTSGTILDTVGTVRIPARAVISIIDVDQNKWKL